MGAIQAKSSLAVVSEEPAPTQLQVFAPGISSDSGFPACAAEVAVGGWQTVELALPAVSGTWQIQPVDRPAIVELREISVYARDGGVVWAANTLPELQALPIAGSLTVLPGQGSCLFFNFGRRPAWKLPLTGLAAAAVLKVVLYVHEDLKAASEALTALYVDFDTMAAQVRTGFADQNKILREFQRQAEAATAERDRTLLQQEEQVKLVQLAEDRNAELQAQQRALEAELSALRAEYEKAQQFILSWEQSRSWRMTRPLRSAFVLAQRFRKNFD